jgi:uncharacterized integral membrane protein
VLGACAADAAAAFRIGNRMIRRILIALVLAALALVLISFAIANRQGVTVSFDPFDQADPAFALSLPLYQLIFLVLILGVAVGGCAAWLRQGQWRSRARSAEKTVALTRIERVPHPSSDSPRLVIPPPAA